MKFLIICWIVASVYCSFVHSKDEDKKQNDQVKPKKEIIQQTKIIVLPPKHIKSEIEDTLSSLKKQPDLKVTKTLPMTNVVFGDQSDKMTSRFVLLYSK